MMKKIVDIDTLEYFAKRIKEYTDVKIGLALDKQTNCPNCGAIITGVKCEYCGTNFGAFVR